MRYFLDKELKGHALIFDGPLDLLQHAEKANRQKAFRIPEPISWPGRNSPGGLDGYRDMVKFLHAAWPEAVNRIKTITDRLKSGDLPQPKDLRRKPQWSDTQGEVDVDRVMHGDYDYMRNVKRQRTVGPFLVTLVNNLDLNSDGHCNPTGVFYRSSLCIALADLLESLGYMTEVWMWCRGTDVYPKPYHKQFVACCPKKAGDPVDYDALCDAMSSWFTTEAIFGSFAACPTPPVALGCGIEANYKEIEVEKTGIDKWIKYLDITEGSLPISLPMIRSWSVEAGYEQCLETSVKILEKIIAAQA